MENRSLLQKLQEARQTIKSTKLTKVGRNDYSKYDYFTPEQVELLVQKACDKVGAIVLCNLKKDKFGLFQELIFRDVDDGLKNSLIFELRTEKGEVTATNETQQMGSTDTYSERYIKMKVFGIKDNLLDPDSQDQRNKKKKLSKLNIKNPMSELQKKHLNEGLQHLPIKEAGLLTAWLEEEHSHDEAKEKIAEINRIADELSA